MHALEETRAELAGHEFDWILVDADGYIAVCETAGFGEMPDAVLSRGKAMLLGAYADSLRALLIELPENGGCAEEDNGVGADVETLGYGKRGIYVFDWRHWSGPYRRIVVPECPILVDDAGSRVQELVASVPRARIRFRMAQEFHLPDLMPCRKSDSG